MCQIKEEFKIVQPELNTFASLQIMIHKHENALSEKKNSHYRQREKGLFSLFQLEEGDLEPFKRA